MDGKVLRCAQDDKCFLGRGLRSPRLEGGSGRVEGGDEGFFLGSGPAFEFFLAGDGGGDELDGFPVDQLVAEVLAGEGAGVARFSKCSPILRSKSFVTPV